MGKFYRFTIHSFTPIKSNVNTSCTHSTLTSCNTLCSAIRRWVGINRFSPQLVNNCHAFLIVAVHLKLEIRDPNPSQFILHFTSPKRRCNHLRGQFYIESWHRKSSLKFSGVLYYTGMYIIPVSFGNSEVSLYDSENPWKDIHEWLLHKKMCLWMCSYFIICSMLYTVLSNLCKAVWHFHNRLLLIVELETLRMLVPILRWVVHQMAIFAL